MSAPGVPVTLPALGGVGRPGFGLGPGLLLLLKGPGDSGALGGCPWGWGTQSGTSSWVGTGERGDDK